MKRLWIILFLLISLSLGACSGGKDVSTPTVTATPIPATITLTATITPTASPSPAPTLTPSPTPAGLRVNWMPETPAGCAANQIRWDHLREDMEKVVELERSANVIQHDQVIAYFHDPGFYRGQGARPLDLNNDLVMDFYATQENGSFFTFCGQLTMPFGTPIAILGVPYPGKDGQVHFLHFAYSQRLFETFQRDGMRETRSLASNYPKYLDGATNHVFEVIMLGGEDTLNAEKAFPGFQDVRDIYAIARGDGFLEAANREFTYRQSQAKDSEWHMLETALIPVMWVCVDAKAPCGIPSGQK